MEEYEIEQQAAEYLRMSTDLQQYSTANQADAIRAYAAARGLRIVATYQDEGKSGLNIAGRLGLQQLIADVQRGAINFRTIIVYDVSRWGRFQDADESAYYEHLCKRAGVRVEYCAELFENDGSPIATIMKGLKRVMAGEYSRELSAKSYAGKHRLILKGFRQGGAAGFGLRRQMVDANGKPKAILQPYEHKYFHSDRVILVPGPPQEIKVVRSIFRRYINGEGEKSLVRWLNDQGLRTEYDRSFTRTVVHGILTNEKYIGTSVWNMTSAKLKGPRSPNKPEQWIRIPGAFKPIVDRKTFEMAQMLRRAKEERATDEEMLEPLKALLKKHGYLSGPLISNNPSVPVINAYAFRFGSLRRAFELAGYVPKVNYRYVEENRRIRLLQPRVCESVVDALRQGSIVTEPLSPQKVLVRGSIVLHVCLTRYQMTAGRTFGWHLTRRPIAEADMILMVRMNEMNLAIKDYVLAPAPRFFKVRRIIRARGNSALNDCITTELRDIPKLCRNAMPSDYRG